MTKQTFTSGQVLSAVQMTTLQQTAMLGGAASAKVASYTLVAADAGDAITMSNAGATTITVNTGLFAAGDIVTILNLGAGACTITAGTATVTTSGSLVLGQNQGGVLRFTSASAAVFLQFATTPSPAENWTLLNAGGTTLAGVKDVTVSGISGQNQLMIIFTDLSSNTARAYFEIHLNSSTTNYTVPTGEMEYTAAYAATNLTSGSINRIRLAKMASTVNSSPVFGYLHVSGCNSSGVKAFMGASGATNSGANDAAAIHLGGIWNDPATISSVRIQTSATQMSNGFTGTARIFVYGRP